jgi:hypothetical protein
MESTVNKASILGQMESMFNPLNSAVGRVCSFNILLEVLSSYRDNLLEDIIDQAQEWHFSMSLFY